MQREPKLCPDCPLPECYQKSLVEKFKRNQYTRIKEEPSPLKECRERRHLLKVLKLKPCPYFYENESIKLFLPKNTMQQTTLGGVF